MSIGKRIKQIRKELGMNQTEFAKRIKITQGAVSAMEKENGSLTTRNIETICKEFGVNEAWLRDGTGDPWVKENRETEIAALVAEVLRDEPESFRATCIEVFAKLDARQLGVLKEIAMQLAEEQKKKENGSG